MAVLGDVVEEVTVGFVGSMAEHYVDDGVIFLRSQNIAPFRLNLSGALQIDGDFHKKLTKSTLKPGDVVTVRTGKPGATAVIPEGMPEANCADLVITRPGEAVDAWWLAAYINSEASHHVNSHLVGAVQQHFNVGAMKRLELRLPPLREQQAIAEVLGALDDKIAANERASGLVEDLLRARFEQMGMIDERVDGGVKLSNVIEFQPRRVATGDVPFIDMQAIPARGWTLPTPSTREAKGGSRFTNGDTLLARITPCLENRKTGYVDDLPEFTVGAGSTELIVMRTRDPHPLPLSFFVATDETFRSYAIQHMVGTSGRQRVSAVDLADFPISMPPPESLQKWGVLADSLFVRVRSMGRENRVLADLREALLPELLSGRLRVKDAEKTVEEVV